MIDQELTRVVTEAMLELCCGNGTLNERLLAASHKLDLLLLRRDKTPHLLLQRAQEIDIDIEVHSQATALGKITDLHEVAARKVAEKILDLYADVHSFRQIPHMQEEGV